MNLFKFEDQSITTETFYRSLKRFIDKDDFIYVEIDLMAFGDIFDVKIEKFDFLNEFYKLFRELVGENGHISFPSFSYSWGDDNKNKIFDVENTPGKVGIFPEFLRKNKVNCRTNDPMFSVIINGQQANKFESLQNNSFGNGSFFHELYKKNAKLISFGLNQYDPTFVHFCEQYFDENIQTIGYRKNKKFEGYMISKNKSFYSSHYAFMRDRKIDLKFSDKKLKSDLVKSSNLEIVEIGRGKVYISDCESVFNASIKNMKNDIYYLVM